MIPDAQSREAWLCTLKHGTTLRRLRVTIAQRFSAGFPRGESGESRWDGRMAVASPWFFRPSGPLLPSVPETQR